MKNYFLLLAILLISINIQAQIPVLTSATTNPSAGETYYRYLCDTTGITDQTTGAGFTWDYSGLTVANYSGSDTCSKISFESCAATPYCTNYPGTTLADVEIGYQAGTGTTDTNYTYYLLNSTEYASLGNEKSINKNTSSPAQVLLNYPFTFSTIQTNAFRYISENYGLDTFYGNYIDSVIGVGYGTLLLPSGTYTNVLKIAYIIHAIDSANISGTPVYDTAYGLTYFWFATGYPIPLLAMSNPSTTSNPVQINMYTQFPLTVNSLSNAINKVTAYPNPASNEVHVSGIIENTSYSINNLQGNCLLNGIINEVSPIINITELQPGFYILYLTNELGNKTILKLVKQ